MINARGRNIVKSLANSFGYRLSKFTNDDVLHVQLTRKAQNPDNFYNALNKAGFQYKSMGQNGTQFAVKLWAKGERPAGKDKAKDIDKDKDKGMDKSSYIRAAEVAKKLQEIVKLANDIPVGQLSFEQAEALGNDKGRLESLKALKALLEKGMDKEKLLAWIDGNITQTTRQIQMLERGLKKSLQQFEAPQIDE